MSSTTPLLVRADRRAAAGTPVPAAPAPAPPSRRRLRRERRATAARLREADLAAARRAELHRMQAALAQARDLVEHGWLQGAWLRVATADGRSLTITSGSLDLVDTRVVTGACLVGAVVRAASEGAPVRALAPSSAQLARRTLDTLWQGLHAQEVRPGRACAPAVLRARVRDLTRWNDAPGRTAGEVADLLDRARDRVRAVATA